MTKGEGDDGRIAREGTREDTVRPLPPAPDWKGRVVTATDDGLSEPKRGKAA